MHNEKDHDIFANSKHIYWFQMPPAITDNTRIELLKRDILVHEHNLAALENLELNSFKAGEDRFCMYFFNFDGLCSIESAKSSDQLVVLAKKLSKLINAFVPHRCIVHSNLLDGRIKSLFNTEKIIFIQKNLMDARIAIQTIHNLVPILLGDQGREKRSFIRINISPEQKIKVQIQGLQPVRAEDGTMHPVIARGTLKDISLSGIAVTPDSEEDFSAFNLKTPVSIKVFLPRVIFRAAASFIVRLDANHKEIGVQFNIHNHKMVSEDDATTLSSFVFQNLRTIFKESKKEPGKAAG